MLDLCLDASWSLQLTSDHRTARLAATELQTFLVQLGAPALPVTSAPHGSRILLDHGPSGDAFVRTTDAHGLRLRGDGPRGLLYAVYDLLEALGCRWLTPDPDGTHVPAHSTVCLPGLAVADRPAFAHRSLIIGHDLFLAQAEAWIIWAVRNRLNTLFIHTTIHEPAFGACRLATWRACRRQLLPLIHDRALRLEIGGHHLRDLLPRRFFRKAPELFRYDGTRRTPDYNFCVSSPQALAYVQQSAAAFARAYPEAEIYHLWPDDLRDGGWCHCPACARLTPSDQALIATNAVAEAVRTHQPQAMVSYLAYHDTEAPPTSASPHPAIQLLTAPRLRSYAAAIDAPVNQIVTAHLTGNRPLFAHQAVFEYYLDGLLFKASPPPLTRIIAADLQAYRANGVSSVHALLTGDRPFAWTPLNAYLFARLAWAPDSDPLALRETYALARTTSPALATHLVEAYDALEAAWQPVLARDPASDHAMRLNLIPSRDPVNAPPMDVLDMLTEPQRTAEQRLEAMLAIASQLQQGQQAWASLASVSDPDLAAEAAEWQLAAELLQFFRLRHQLYVLAARKAAPATLYETVHEAQASLDRLYAWAQQHVPPAAQPGHRLLRTIFQLHLDHIADLHLLKPWHRLGLRARRASDLALMLSRVIRP
ncbi:DUF4838 domain-containing protein [Candidatus Chloroploca sp. M-50]|uniref:DUF4838 domain-containing protein n=1 Tax=Candidatus Chloroploca mongolica TaxID=2528176 RepID=A0ABS4DC32_9CHLR|nr:DUF4838 domain-containing protein [Candidatus Chloroploca mongolica]MBP1467005.1 DUF4838 domain-containing protein [Candidatus Chloroploca mongolica]